MFALNIWCSTPSVVCFWSSRRIRYPVGGVARRGEVPAFPIGSSPYLRSGKYPFASAVHHGTSDKAPERILKFPLTLALVATIPLISHAQPIGAPGRLSGSQAVERWIGPSKFDRTAAQLYDLQYVDGYLAGVADAGEGKEWCDTHKVKAHEIDAYVVWALKDMSTEQLQRSAAAKLMIALLAKRFPCAQGKVKP